MNEIKFACPYCAQRISVEPAQAGSNIACPSCNKLLVVPRMAGASAPPPLPPMTAGPGGAPPVRSGGGSSTKVWLIVGIAAAAFLLLLIAGIGGVFLLRKAALAKAHRPHAHSSQHTHDAQPADSANTTGNTDASTPPPSDIPADPVSGTADGEEFTLRGSKYDNDRLTLDTGLGFGKDIHVFTFFRGQSPEGKTIVVPNPDSGPGVITPHVHIPASRKGMSRREIVSRDYVMRLEFGKAMNGKLPGKISFEAPQGLNTSFAGSFEANWGP